MSEQSDNRINRISRWGAIGAVTYLALSVGVPPSAREQTRVNTCAAELGPESIHVDSIPKACESYPVYTNGPSEDGYDLIPAAQFREENSPGLGFDLGCYAVILAGGIVTRWSIRKLGAAMMAPPDSASQHYEATKKRPPRLPQRTPGQPDADFTLASRRPVVAEYDKNVRQPVHDNSAGWELLDACQKLIAEQRQSRGEA